MSPERTSLAAWCAARQDAAIGAIVMSLAKCSGVCAIELRSHVVVKAKNKGTNTFGDDVLSVDLICDKIIQDELKANKHVASFASEETPELQQMNRPGYCVAFDPLDGSSIIGSNFAVGSIFGVWKGSDMVGQKVSDQHAAAITVYGPRTTFFVATKESKSVAQFMLNHDHIDRSLLVQEHTVKPKAKVFAPGNLRAANKLDWYREIILGHIQGEATLRYTGGMVPDVAQIFVKGNGVFMTPRSPDHKVKLRVSFECGPIAFLMHAAGGASTDGTKSFWDHTVAAVDERTAIAVGSKEDIAAYEAAAKLQSKL